MASIHSRLLQKFANCQLYYNSENSAVKDTLNAMYSVTCVSHTNPYRQHSHSNYYRNRQKHILHISPEQAQEHIYNETKIEIRAICLEFVNIIITISPSIPDHTTSLWHQYHISNSELTVHQ